MKLVVGLGNPGLAYKNTRHNLGFMVADALARDFGVRLQGGKSNSLNARLVFKKKDFILCKPLTFMNLAGSAVSKLAVEFKLAPEDVLVICDDINLELGRIKIKASGSSGGHKGLDSVSQALESRNFARLRIGIAAPENREGLSGYVLSPFSHKEQKVIRNSMKKAKEAVLCWLEGGIGAAMSSYNRMKEKENG